MHDPLWLYMAGMRRKHHVLPVFWVPPLFLKRAARHTVRRCESRKFVFVFVVVRDRYRDHSGDVPAMLSIELHHVWVLLRGSGGGVVAYASDFSCAIGE